MQLPIGARVGVASRGEEVGGHVPDRRDESDDLNGLVHLRQRGEELGLHVALEDLGREGVARPVGGLEPIRVRLVQEHLSLEHVRRLARALHVGQEFEREGRGDLLDRHVPQHDPLQEARLGARGAGRPGERVVDEELERALSVLVPRVLDLGDERLHEFGVLDGLGVKALALTGLDLLEVFGVNAHGHRWVVGPLAR